MTVDLDDVFASVGVRRQHRQHQHLIDEVAGGWLDHFSQPCSVGALGKEDEGRRRRVATGGGADEAARDLERSLAAQAYDRESARGRTRREGYDRVAACAQVAVTGGYCRRMKACCAMVITLFVSQYSVSPAGKPMNI